MNLIKLGELWQRHWKFWPTGFDWIAVATACKGQAVGKVQLPGHCVTLRFFCSVRPWQEARAICKKAQLSIKVVFHTAYQRIECHVYLLIQ